MEKEFKLPDKWKIEFNNNWRILSKFKPFDKNFNGNADKGSFYCYNSNYNNSYCYSKNNSEHKNFIEITLPQFQQYVLKENIDKYWRVALIDNCQNIEDSKKGDIFKSKDEKNWSFISKNNYSWGLNNNEKSTLFYSLEEAQEFSNSLLNKDKKLTINDLVEGEVYWFEVKNYNERIGKYLGNGNFANIYIKGSELNNLHTNCTPSKDLINFNTLRLATSVEKKQLLCSIQQNKFIPQSELDKYDDEGNMIENIPEYVQLLDGWSDSDEFAGEIFDTKKDFQEQFKKFKGITKSWNWKFILTEKNHKDYFKPSTKEAYESQFKNYPLTKEESFTFEFNKWYKNPNSKWMCFIKSETEGYGFSSKGDWFNDVEKWASHIYKYPQASEKEVRQRLLEYAKEHYPIKTIIKSALYLDKNPSRCVVDEIGEFDFAAKRLVLWNIENKSKLGFLYDNGNWAEIVSKPKNKELNILENKKIFLLDSFEDDEQLIGITPILAVNNKLIIEE